MSKTHHTKLLWLLVAAGLGTSACASGGQPIVDRAFVVPASGSEAGGAGAGRTTTAAGQPSIMPGETDGDVAASEDAASTLDADATPGSSSENDGSSTADGGPGDAGTPAGAGQGPGASAGRGGGASTTAGKVPGVTDDVIELVYYWSASQTDNNPFLAAFPEANADERRLIETFIKYINANDGKGTLYGHPINLHGRRIELTVVDAGLYSEPEKNRAAAELIAKELRPFAAISNGGVISTRICPILAAEKVVTLGVLSYLDDLAGRSGGYCLPAMAPIEAQADVTFDYIVNRLQHEPFINELGQEVPRVFGITYGEWPEMVQMAPAFGERLRKAGVKVPVIAAGGEDLGPQQQQAPGIVAQFRQAGVNTVIMPDAVIPIALTAAADAQSFITDYYIWPCSGEDAATLVRFYSAKQWERASGLTCFDPAWAVDIADERMDQSEWMRQYRSQETSAPAAAAPLIYNYLMPLVVGVSRAGRDLTPASFLAGLRSMTPYRYDFIKGATTNAARHRVGPFLPGLMAAVNDFAYLEWDNQADSGQDLPGTYVFPDGARRYRPGDFR